MSKSIQKIRLEQEALIKEIRAARKKNDRRIAELVHRNGVITRAQIGAIQPGIPFTAIPGLCARRIPTEDPDQIIMMNEFGPMIEVEAHEHDCCERGTVIRGELQIDGKWYRPGETYFIEVGVLHTVRTKFGAVFITEHPPIKLGNPHRR